MSEAATAQFQQEQRRLQALDRHLASLEQSLAEIDSALATLAGLDGQQESLIPIGAGVRVRAQVDASAPVLMDVGAGMVIEGDTADANARLVARKEATEAAFRSANDEADRLAQSLQDLQARLAPVV